jgi:hypothetical protein
MRLQLSPAWIRIACGRTAPQLELTARAHQYLAAIRMPQLATTLVVDDDFDTSF